MFKAFNDKTIINDIIKKPVLSKTHIIKELIKFVQGQIRDEKEIQALQELLPNNSNEDSNIITYKTSYQIFINADTHILPCNNGEKSNFAITPGIINIL